ncbi:hypothetical protein TNCV_2086981 [Trichonephila clavipes]|nr:hypothetical protein TNCV_2086981 [Trichonephila clavipes]
MKFELQEGVAMDSNTKLRTGSQHTTPIIITREDRHVTRMTSMDGVAKSRGLSQKLGSFTRQVSARTVRRPLDSILTRSFTNGKCLVYSCRATSLSPYATVYEQWYRVEAVWSSVRVHAIQSLFDLMHRRISAVITTRGGCFRY